MRINELPTRPSKIIRMLGGVKEKKSIFRKFIKYQPWLRTHPPGPNGTNGLVLVELAVSGWNASGNYFMSASRYSSDVLLVVHNPELGWMYGGSVVEFGNDFGEFQHTEQYATIIKFLQEKLGARHMPTKFLNALKNGKTIAEATLGVK